MMKNARSRVCVCGRVLRHAPSFPRRLRLPSAATARGRVNEGSTIVHTETEGGAVAGRLTETQSGRGGRMCSAPLSDTPAMASPQEPVHPQFTVSFKCIAFARNAKTTYLQAAFLSENQLL
ncbi:hypothetical protein SKAU_G00368030 [Synaphobranchus kaupii]|uniref:Uncharacterized protein n=1 Tax=Synaphobranchus kaupii TaxID=118154 RepID=A0A9Q1EFH5_SYNKA|nr:hypothetical protein SKAU_G00368030 [Synaphobranchus kaupii]